MKVSAVSGDLLLKVGIGVVVLGAVGFALWRFKDVITDTVLPAVNPADANNVVNRGVTAIGDAVVSPTGPGRNADGSWTLGGMLYDLTHSDPLKATPPATTAPLPEDPYDVIFTRRALPVDAGVSYDALGNPTGNF